MLVTQADLATKHGISVSSLSNNLRRLEDFFEEYWAENDNLTALTSSNKVEEMTAYSELEHEKMLRKIQKLMESQDYEGPEGAQNFLALQLNNSELLRNDSPISLEKKAYELMIRAELETSLAKKKKLVSQARELDPNNSDALPMLSKLSTDISEAIKLARKQNRHVPAYLLGKETLPSTQPQYMTPGDINDAVQYVDSHENLWARLYGLIEWIKKQA